MERLERRPYGVGGPPGGPADVAPHRNLDRLLTHQLLEHCGRHAGRPALAERAAEAVGTRVSLARWPCRRSRVRSPSFTNPDDHAALLSYRRFADGRDRVVGTRGLGVAVPGPAAASGRSPATSDPGSVKIAKAQGRIAAFEEQLAEP